ncbi:MAG: hypothetical protein AAF915_23825 [Cyanobacteria bacterium P01_D01_bin.50]
MSLKKIKGLYTIINPFIPIIWITIFVSIFFDVSHLANTSINRINGTFISAIATLEEAADSLNNSVKSIGNLEATLSQVSQQINSIPEEIKIPDIQIPDANLPIKPKVKISNGLVPRVSIDNIRVDMPTIPGLAIPLVNIDKLKDFLEIDLDILKSLNQLIGIIPNLDALKEYGEEIIYGTGEIGNLIQSIVQKFIFLLITVAIIAMIAIPILILKYFNWFRDQIVQGWLLLNNKG